MISLEADLKLHSGRCEECGGGGEGWAKVGFCWRCGARSRQSPPVQATWLALEPPNMPPKKSALPTEPPPPPPPAEPQQLSPNATFLRTSEKFAAVCQYLYTFYPAIGVQDYTVQVRHPSSLTPRAGLWVAWRASGYYGGRCQLCAVPPHKPLRPFLDICLPVCHTGMPISRSASPQATPYPRLYVSFTTSKIPQTTSTQF